jgi:hypothetical protein
MDKGQECGMSVDQRPPTQSVKTSTAQPPIHLPPASDPPGGGWEAWRWVDGRRAVGWWRSGGWVASHLPPHPATHRLASRPATCLPRRHSPTHCPHPQVPTVPPLDHPPPQVNHLPTEETQTAGFHLENIDVDDSTSYNGVHRTCLFCMLNPREQPPGIASVLQFPAWTIRTHAPSTKSKS